MSCSVHTYELLVKWPTAAPRLVTQSVCWRRSQPRVWHCFFCRVWMTFLFFLSSDTTPASMWLHWEIDETEKKEKKPNTHQSLFQHIFSFLLVYFFSCLEKQKQKLITDDPPSSIPKARPRVGRAARFVKIHEKIQMRVHLIQSSSESRDPSAGV